MRTFVYTQPSIRVVFGIGTFDRLAEEVAHLGARRGLVLSTPGQRRLADQAAGRLGGLLAGVFPEAAMHVPIASARAASAVAARVGADCTVAVGGGSTIGLAKAIALDLNLPIVAIPTTYSGSEMTPIYGLLEGGVKRNGRDGRVLPKAVIYDAGLTTTLPPRVSGPSGLNAIAHCVEALYARDGSPISGLAAAEGIRALARSLPRVVQAPADLDARSEALYGAWLAGTALATSSMGLHHKLCHTLGGAFNLPHADVHAVILPHATSFNRDAAPQAMQVIAQALGADDAAQGIYDLAVNIAAPVSLERIGMPRDGLDRAAALAVESPYANPRPVDFSGVRGVLDDAYHGRRPTIDAASAFRRTSI
jgi:maleylacetate reductase